MRFFDWEGRAWRHTLGFGEGEREREREKGGGEVNSCPEG